MNWSIHKGNQDLINYQNYPQQQSTLVGDIIVQESIGVTPAAPMI